MKWIKRFFEKPPHIEPDRVLLVLGGSDQHHKLVDVEWFCGRAYASAYVETRAELLPGGKVSGAPCYLQEWKPATERMQQHFNANTRPVRTDGPPRDSGTHEAVVGHRIEEG